MTEPISRKYVGQYEVLFDQTTPNLKISFWWDAHGKDVSWTNDDGKHAISYKNARVKLIKKSYKFIAFGKELPEINEDWQLYINNEKFNDGEITYYNRNDSRILIHSCIGAG